MTERVPLSRPPKVQHERQITQPFLCLDRETPSQELERGRGGADDKVKGASNFRPSEAAPRKQNHEPTPLQEERQLLYTRAQVAALLGCSTATVIRLQHEGRLHGIRLSLRPTGQVYFKKDHVLALVAEARDA